MRKSIQYLAMVVLLVALGSCSTNSFVSNTNRFNYIKSDKQEVHNAQVQAEVNENSQKPIAENSPIEPVAGESTSGEVQNRPEDTRNPVTKATKTPERKVVVANSSAEEEELLEKSLSETPSKTRSYINIPAPDKTTKEKSQLTALLLCLILGMIGVHRFYLGKPLGGIIILALTLVGIAYPPAFALAGLIVLVDAVRLLFGGLGPGW